MEKVSEVIPGYSYGTPEVAPSPVSMREFNDLKVSGGFTEEDERYLRLALAVLADQTKQIVDHWRSGIIAGIPNLAAHSRTPERNAIPDYLATSNLRFQQWILDTCLRPYDQAGSTISRRLLLRHTAAKKNKVDGARSTPHVPLRDVIAFIAYEHNYQAVSCCKRTFGRRRRQYARAWCKSIQLQLALWIGPYADARRASKEW